VLHLSRGVCVGGDVGDLLQLQRALQRHWQADVAADVQEEHALPVGVGHTRDRLAHAGEHLLDAVRQALDLADQLLQPRGLERAAQLGQAQREAAAHREPEDEGLLAPAREPAELYVNLGRKTYSTKSHLLRARPVHLARMRDPGLIFRPRLFLQRLANSRL